MQGLGYAMKADGGLFLRHAGHQRKYTFDYCWNEAC